ncbi:hypothetical protein JVT61DRAFT_6914 [Boletus reticuloceps]|uniref:Uncharacterized protein n=1 Tax=Boletus reticuloceps TaxID=495285 RepID=A0A8I2YJT8_9AGAM|nr:hypothetical protein JVT61DRAFT_6914 [Boletus reticuloceps]
MDDASWGVIYDGKEILEIPHHIQQTMSHESLPRLGKSVPTFEFFMKAWEILQTKTPRLQPFIGPGLVKAEKYYNKMENSPAYVVAMCKSAPIYAIEVGIYLTCHGCVVVDPVVQMSWITQHWDAESNKTARNTIINLMIQYRATKMKEKDLGQSNMQADQSQGHMGCLPALAAKYGFVGDNAWNPLTQGSDLLLPVETEYQNYTEQSLSSSSDPLAYWVVSRTFQTVLWATDDS